MLPRTHTARNTSLPDDTLTCKGGCGHGVRLRTVVPCVNYDDFLALTLPGNLTRLPSITVLTSPHDEPTLRLCRTLGVEVFATPAWHIGGPLNKAAALNEWVAHTTAHHPGDWLMTLDADILLPTGFNLPLESLDPRNLYSVRRRLCPDPLPLRDYLDHRIPLTDFPLDAVPVINGLLWGYYPGTQGAGLVGYLQLWSPAHSVGAKHFEATGSAEAYDLTFGLSFPEEHRAFIEGQQVLHLGPTGINWHGRRTPRWLVPEPLPPHS